MLVVEPPEHLDKSQWRSRLLAARRVVPARLRAAEAALLAAGVLATVRGATGPVCGHAAAGATGPVCGYAPLASEPGSLAMLDALRGAGYEVLLPVLPVDRHGAALPARPMSWTPYLGASSLVAGPFGLRQPIGPARYPSALVSARLVLVPALAVDRHGVRLGRGAGWYDRTLPLARPGTPLIAVVRDEEFVVALPAEHHDVLMTGVLTPQSGVRALPAD